MAHQRAAPKSKSSGGNPLVKQYAKAITALLTPLVALAATKAGLNLPDEVCCGVAAAATGVLVAIVPNSYGTG